MTTIKYIEPVFRPPSEANSLILQVTNGCSWNRCAFCEMYTDTQKRFALKNETLIFDEIKKAAQRYPQTRRIFLADGDAMVLSTRRLLAVLSEIRRRFPNIHRVSSYCLPRNVKSKSIDELVELREAGLELVYVGAETGDDALLQLIDKGETFASMVHALQKIRSAGIKSSVMILNGLGGNLYSRQHALNSARLVNEIQPNFLATLVLTFPRGNKRFLQRFPAGFALLDQTGLFQEMQTFVKNTELKNTVFRSDHASNYLVLKGILGKDKSRLLDQIRLAIEQPDAASLRAEWQRGL